MKFLILTLILFTTSSCEFFGWDSSGGNNCDPKCHSGVSSDKVIFYLEIPENYPYLGNAEIINDNYGNKISIRLDEFKFETPYSDLSDTDAFDIAYNACDKSVSDLTEVVRMTDSAIIWWVSAENESLSLKITDYPDLSFRLISCIYP